MKKVWLLLLFLFNCFALMAQHTYSGKVVDESNHPLAYATIRWNNDKIITADHNGNYTFQTDSINFLLTFIYAGYEIKTINIKDAEQPPLIKLIRVAVLPDIEIAAFGRNSDINNVSAPVSVLTTKMLQRFNGASFVQSVNTVPGVKMDERSPGSYRLSIRGNLLRSTFGVRNVKVYWNGIPLTDASGNTYFNELSLSNIDRTEIIKGPASSMYGAGTGGVVLLSNESARDKSATVQLSGGSYGAFHASASYQNNNKVPFTISFDHQQSDGYRDQTAMRRDVANFTSRTQINKKQTINANIFYSDLYYQTPGGLTLVELTANPRQSRPAAGTSPSAEAQRAAIYLKTIYAGISHQYQLNNKWNNTTSVYASYTDFRNPAIRNYEDKYEKGIGGRSVFQYRGKLFTHTFGGEYQSGYINTGVYGNRLGTKDTLQYNDEIISRQYNVFAQTDVNVSKRIIVTAGLSYNNFHYGFDRLSAFTPANEKSDFTPQLAPRIAAILHLKKLNVYAAISKGYSPPSIDEVHASDGNFNVNLKAETGFNYEVGVKGNLIKNKLWLDASTYIFGLKNTIVSRRDSTGADYYLNSGNTRQHGTEVMLNYVAFRNGRLIDFIKISLSYTNIHARFKNYQQGTVNYNGNKLTGTPPNVVSTAIDIRTKSGIYSNLTYSYTDRIPLNDANTFYGTSYNILFAKLGYQTFYKKSTADFFMAYQHCFNSLYGLGNDLNAAGNRFYNPSAVNDLTIGMKINQRFK